MSKKTNPARDALIKLSGIAKQQQTQIAAVSSEVPSINELLMMMHKEASGGVLFLTLKKWSAAGYKVKRNESSYRIWAKPTRAKTAKDQSEDGEQDEYKYFPMCCLFHEGQVEAQEGATPLDELSIAQANQSDKSQSVSKNDNTPPTIENEVFIVQCTAEYPHNSKFALVPGDITQIHGTSERAKNVRKNQPIEWAGGSVHPDHYKVLYHGDRNLVPVEVRQTMRASGWG